MTTSGVPAPRATRSDVNLVSVEFGIDRKTCTVTFERKFLLVKEDAETIHTEDQDHKRNATLSTTGSKRRVV